LSLPRLKLLDGSAIPSESPAQKSPPTRNFSPEFIQRYSDPVIREENRQKATENAKASVKPLNRRQIRFVKEYLADPGRNGTQAAIAAGYGPDRASDMASYNLKHPQIRAMIEAEDSKLYRRLDISAERVAAEIAAIAYARLPDFLSDKKDKDGVYQVDLDKIDAVQAAAIQEYSVERVGSTLRTKVRLYDKLQALTLIGRSVGLGIDSTPTQNTNNLALTINLLDDIVAGKATLPPNVTIEGGK
jgi:phage terminase small subunit